ncbi:MAG TPA: N-acetylornithine carbamoyltransferase [Gemmatimonadales bacterium]|jgi:N-acetylornithine carbamoyltransferase|nr:N-acetylornithine carbamoyltransferase [Gemmatimonadales bacterium]
MTKRDYLAMEDWSPDAIDHLLALAQACKRGEITGGLTRKVLAMVFMDPSLRTRASMETAMFLHGGHALSLEPGKGSWALETDLDVTMDGSTVEHIIEAARVLARYADALAVRIFPKGTDWAVERLDPTIRNFARYSDKPVINLESSRRHPCQGLADAMTLQERLGDTAGKRFVLMWAWHPKPLPTAVPASAAIAAAHLGMQVTIARPAGYDLDPDDYRAVETLAASRGGSLTVTDDLDGAIDGAHAVYAKSWGALSYFGNIEGERTLRDGKRDWRLTAERMRRTAGGNGFAMHCLPVRRNVEIDGEVLDGPQSAVIDEAENRLHAQRALLLELIGTVR